MAGPATLLADLEAERSTPDRRDQRRREGDRGAAGRAQGPAPPRRRSPSPRPARSCVAAGDKGCQGGRRRACARSRPPRSERVTEEFQAREQAEQRATEQKIADLERRDARRARRATARSAKRAAEGRKDEIRRQRDEIEGLKPLMTLTETDFRYLDEKYGAGAARGGRIFWAGMGAEAVRDIITRMELEELGRTLHVEVRTTSGQRRKKAIKRLRLIEAFRRSGTRPEWMILSVLPVHPARAAPDGPARRRPLRDLRPERPVPARDQPEQPAQAAPGARCARDHHPQREADAPGGVRRPGRQRPPRPGDRRDRATTASRACRDMLKGKQGRFRQNLLGKRVDYSGRSVIVVGPELKLHQCGLPKKMALELFKPFVMRQLVEKGFAHNIKSAKRIVERVRTPRSGTSSKRSSRTTRSCSTARPPSTGWASRRSCRSSSRARRSRSTRSSARRSTPTSTATRWRSTCRSPRPPRKRRGRCCSRPRTCSRPPTAARSSSPTQDMVLGCYYLTTDVPERDRDGNLPAPRPFADEEAALLAYELSSGGMAGGSSRTSSPFADDDPRATSTTAPCPCACTSRSRSACGPGTRRPARWSTAGSSTTVGRIIFNQVAAGAAALRRPRDAPLPPPRPGRRLLPRARPDRDRPPRGRRQADRLRVRHAGRHDDRRLRHRDPDREEGSCWPPADGQVDQDRPPVSSAASSPTTSATSRSSTSGRRRPRRSRTR